MNSHIYLLENHNETLKFLSQDDNQTEGRWRVRINPDQEHLPDGKPVPDIYIDALRVIQKGHDEPYYLFTNLLEHDLRSYLVAESFIIQGPEPSKLPEFSTTDPAGALRYESHIQRSVEHHEIKRLLEKEERDRGFIGEYNVKISNDKVFGGMNPTPTGEMKAKRVIKDNIAYYILSNEFDNYLRPDLVTEDYFESAPELVSLTTPHAEEKAKLQKEVEEKRSASQKQEEEQRERTYKMAKAHRDEAISIVNSLNKLIGNRIPVPSILQKGDQAASVENIHLMKGIVKMASEYFEIKGEMPKVGYKSTLSPVAALQDVYAQIYLDVFLEKNDFYLKITDTDHAIEVGTFGKDDIQIASAIIDKSKISTKEVSFYDEDRFDFSENLEVLSLDTVENGTVYELGQELDDIGALDPLWEELANIHLTEEWDDLPSLSHAAIDGHEMMDINDFTAIQLMMRLESKKGLISQITKGVSVLESQANPTSQEDPSREIDQLDNAANF